MKSSNVSPTPRIVTVATLIHKGQARQEQITSRMKVLGAEMDKIGQEGAAIAVCNAELQRELDKLAASPVTRP